MKLLFDENLSPQLPRLVGDHFPLSLHVRDCGLKGQSDTNIWDYARLHGYTLVSKDNDFYQRILVIGPPPKLIWLCLGNCSRQQLLQVLLQHELEILALETAEESILILS